MRLRERVRNDVKPTNGRQHIPWRSQKIMAQCSVEDGEQYTAAESAAAIAVIPTQRPATGKNASELRSCNYYPPILLLVSTHAPQVHLAEARGHWAARARTLRNVGLRGVGHFRLLTPGPKGQELFAFRFMHVRNVA